MKKWTYLVAAGMLLGAAPVFTGCIDNDEPEGITILRGAKAELLKAKAAVEAAKVAQVQAEAALLEAQAKYQEALAVTEAANAKIQEAIAKQEEAKAALLETQNEQAKQELQAAIAELEHQKEMWEIEKNNALTAAEQAAKMWELSYKQAEVAYEEALVSLEKQKTALTQQQLDVLNPYITALKEAKDAYAQKVEKVRKAQRKVDEAAELVEETEADKEYWQYNLARDLKLENYKLEGIEAAKTKAVEELAEFEEKLANKDATPIAQKLDELEAEQQAMLKEIADESVKAAEAKREIYTTDVMAYYDKVDAWYENRKAEIEIPEFTFPEDVKGEALPFAWKDIKDDEYPATSYSLANPNEYTWRWQDLNNLLTDFKSWTRDENDDAWSQQRIAEWNKDIEDVEANIETQKKSWQEAVDAYYRLPADAVIDLSKISGYTDFVAALSTFNNAVKENQKAYKDIELAYQPYNEYTNYTYWDLMKNISNDYETGKQTIPTYEDKEAEFIAIQDALRAEAEEIENDPEATQEEKDAAWEAYYNAYPYQQYDKFYTEAIEALDEARMNAIKEARSEWDKLADKYETAITTYNTKREALDEECEKIMPLYEIFRSNASTTVYDEDANYTWYVTALLNYEYFPNATGKYYGDYDHAYIKKWNDNYIDEWNYQWQQNYDQTTTRYFIADTYEVAQEYITEVSRESMRNLIAIRSMVLYGTAYDNYNPYGDPDSRLLELTFEDVQKLIEASSEEPLYGEAYLEACSHFGLMGQVYILKAQIEFAEAWIADQNSSVNKLINAVSSAITAMESELEAKLEKSEEEAMALNEEYLTIEQKLAELSEPVDKLRMAYEPLTELIGAVKDAISTYQNAGLEVWSLDAIEGHIKWLEAKIRGLELAIEDQKHNIETAQRNLDGYNSEQLTALQTAQNTLEDAEAQMKIAEATYNDALELLKKIINKMSLEVSDDTTTTEPAE